MIGLDWTGFGEGEHTASLLTSYHVCITTDAFTFSIPVDSSMLRPGSGDGARTREQNNSQTIFIFVVVL